MNAPRALREIMFIQNIYHIYHFEIAKESSLSVTNKHTDTELYIIR